ncbi:MarR family winged helix-turn-helix transcriptional regulator [Methylobacterium sp. JK268]
MTETIALTPAMVAAIGRSCVCFSVQRAARSLGRHSDAAFRSLGLSSWQFALMMMLTRPQPATLSELAEGLAMDRTTITANLKPLERRGLVQVEVDAADRRVRRPQLTEEGRALLLQAIPLWEKTQAGLMERLAAFDVPELRKALAALTDQGQPLFRGWPEA